MVEILKQGQYQPLTTEKQILIIFVGVNGMLDDIPIEECQRFEKEFLQFVENNHKNILTEIKEKKEISKEMEEKMKNLIKEFKQSFSVSKS